MARDQKQDLIVFLNLLYPNRLIVYKREGQIIGLEVELPDSFSLEDYLLIPVKELVISNFYLAEDNSLRIGFSSSGFQLKEVYPLLYIFTSLEPRSELQIRCEYRKHYPGLFASVSFYKKLKILGQLKKLLESLSGTVIEARHRRYGIFDNRTKYGITYYSEKDLPLDQLIRQFNEALEKEFDIPKLEELEKRLNDGYE